MFWLSKVKFVLSDNAPHRCSIFISESSNQCITSKDIKFAERASCFCLKPTADAFAMKMVRTGKAIQFCSFNIRTKADTAFLQHNPKQFSYLSAVARCISTVCKATKNQGK